MFLKTVLTYLFYAICSTIAVWMTYRQIDIYLLNEDATSIQYKSFSAAIKNYYPDITFCLHNLNPSDQFDESTLPFNITSTELTSMLDGTVSDESMSKKGDKNSLEKFVEFILKRNMSFEDLINSKSKNIISGYFMQKTMPSDGCNHDFLANLEKTFDSLYYRCWTRSYDYMPNQLLKSEFITLIPGVLSDFRYIYIALHQEHQTLRHEPISVAHLMDVKIAETQKIPSLVINVNHIKVIRRRHSANEKCDQHLDHDDNKFLQEASKSLGCIPIFWIELSEGWKDTTNLSYCTDPNAYYKASVLGKHWDVRHLVYKEYEPPCSKMLVTYDLSTKEDESFLRKHLKLYYNTEIEGDLMIKILYSSDEYEEIKNLRKFDEESLFSQIGGFIGIMLGASVFHIPEIMATVISKLSTMFKRGTDKVRKERSLDSAISNGTMMVQEVHK